MLAAGVMRANTVRTGAFRLPCVPKHPLGSHGACKQPSQQWPGTDPTHWRFRPTCFPRLSRVDSEISSRDGATHSYKHLILNK